MAKFVKKIPPPKPVQSTVVMEFTQDEIDFLADVLGYVGGDLENSRRGHQIIISTALYKAGAVCDDDLDEPKYDIEGKIEFKDSK